MIKRKTIIAGTLASFLLGGCVLEGVTAGAVLGFVANNALKASEVAGALKLALERYRESESTSQKIKVLAEVSCHFRTHHPDQMEYLRGKLMEAGISEKIVFKARDIAEKKCGHVENDLIFPNE